MQGLIQFFLRQKNAVLMLIAFWHLFFVSEFIRRWYLNNQWNGSMGDAFLQLRDDAFLIYPWLLFSLLIGWLVYRWPITRQASRWVMYILTASLMIVIDVALIASTYWLFTPHLVAKVTFTYVFFEQFFKWAHIQVLLFAGLLAFWHWLLTRQHRQATHIPVFTVKVNHHKKLIKANQILWIEADDNYVHLHLADQSYMYREPISSLEQQLAHLGFIRSHRSALINGSAVTGFEPALVLLKHGHKAPVSRRRRGELKERLEIIAGAV